MFNIYHRSSSYRIRVIIKIWETYRIRVIFSKPFMKTIGESATCVMVTLAEGCSHIICLRRRRRDNFDVNEKQVSLVLSAREISPLHSHMDSLAEVLQSHTLLPSLTDNFLLF